MASALERCTSSFVLLVVVATLLAGNVATSRSLSHEVKMAAKHERWMARHGRSYASKEEKEARFKIFKDNVKFIRNFNRAANATYKLGINQFADLTDDEFLASHASGFKKALSGTYSESLQAKSFLYENVSLDEVEPSMDWRAMGAVTPIKNQDACGTCWIFAAVAAIEGINKIKTGNLVSLSEQEVMDCIEPGRYMCRPGGTVQHAYDFVIRNGGLTSEEAYPYTTAYEYCAPSGYPAATISYYENVPQGDEGALLRVASRQPVAVSIDATSLKFFRSGIVNAYCGTNVNHGVTVVGYGTRENGQKYWLVKNSWGTSWGENGYSYIERDSDMPGGMCGIALYASYPIIF